MESKNYDFKQLNNKNYQFYSKEDALKLINGRDIYVWAASFRGIGFAKALKREGMQVKAFLDSSPLLYDKEYDGIPVLRPDIILKNANFLKNSFIFVASTGYSMQEIYKMCENAGLKKSKDFLNYQALSPFSPCIEISGICTLKCVTCPRGTHDKPFPNGKFMTAETYSKIIEKMINEIPFMSFVDLYVWGDPMLNPELPEIININKSLGITTALSTNLNVTKNLEYVIKALPEHIRVSISGVGEKYEITHTGGEWEKLYKNLLLLSEYQAKHKSDSIVEIYFHVYKHNIEDVKTLKNFCKQHNFHFKYVCAMFFPRYSSELL